MHCVLPAPWTPRTMSSVLCVSKEMSTPTAMVRRWRSWLSPTACSASQAAIRAGVSSAQERSQPGDWLPPGSASPSSLHSGREGCAAPGCSVSSARTSHLADSTTSDVGRSWGIGSSSCVIPHTSGSLAGDGYRRLRHTIGDSRCPTRMT